jgi:hypothetical protein
MRFIMRFACTSIQVIAVLVTGVLATGCVRRTITITSDPSGALCWLNGREVGRTPLEVDFLYYGEYDVVLQEDGFDPLLTSGKAEPPWWDNIPLDLAAEMTPGEREAKVAWHYTLPPRNDDPAALLDRARELRQQFSTPEAPATSPQPATQANSSP